MIIFKLIKDLFVVNIILNSPTGNVVQVFIIAIKLMLEYGEKMQAVLDKANELGVLLKSTKAFMDFNSIKDVIENNSSAKEILDAYNAVAEEIHQKQQKGVPIESFEQQEFKELTKKIVENPLLKDYIQKRNNYMAILMRINESMIVESGEK